MASAYIVKRNTASGVSYQVKYRLGGRATRIQHAGTFRSLQEARVRANWVRGEIAANRSPELSLAGDPLADLSCYAAIQRLINERPDASPNTVRSWQGCLLVAPQYQVTELTIDRCQQWVNYLAERFAPGTANVRISTLAAALDHVGLTPNPLHNKRVRRPKNEPTDAVPVLDEHWAVLREQLLPHNRDAAELIELTALRRSEAEALVWDDVDLGKGLLRVRKGKTRAARRVLRLCDWSPEAWDLLRRLWNQSAQDAVLQTTATALQSQLQHLSAKNGFPSYGPHALRHRRATIWINEGVPPREVAYRLGHQNTSTTLNTYTHRSLGAPK